MQKLLGNLKEDIKVLNEINKQPILLIVTKVRNNNGLYKLYQPEIHESDHHKCLLCTSIIKTVAWGKFMECNHRFCLKCVKYFLPEQAKCPFDSYEPVTI